MSIEHHPTVIVAGHLCLDIIPTLHAGTEIVPGHLVEVGEAHLSTGGCVSNVGQALNRLGVSVRLLGKVGDDPFGEIVACRLRAESVQLAEGLVVETGGQTSYSIVISPPGKDRTFLHMPGCNNTFSAEDVKPESLTGAKLFHFGYPPLMARMFEDSGAELAQILALAQEKGLKTSLDMSLPDPHSPSGRADWLSILNRVLPRVDFFLPSEDELRFMLRMPTASLLDLADKVLEMGAGMVVIKRGELGLYAKRSDEDTVWESPCFQTQVVGTTGAGDATIAGFLMGVVRGMSWPECLIAGCAVGACCVEAADAVSGIRSWFETRQKLEL